uniref:Uncharacterized protein n=1 Tax=Asparagus officinalis TaxID=4686 RepID=Q2XNT9_ASPOF|nr:hypothetical protein 12.t00052 [Asparagus officinalis]
MATPLGTSFSNEEVVAQSDVHLNGTTVETLVVEFDQAKYEEVLSSGLLSPKARRDACKSSKEVLTAVETPKKALSFGQSLKLALQAEDHTSISTRLVLGCKRPITEKGPINADDAAAKALKQAKKNAFRRWRRSIRRAHLRENQSLVQRKDCVSEDLPKHCVHTPERTLRAMGTAPSKTWKDLKVRGEQAERFLRRKKAERSQPAANPPNLNFASHGRGKAPAADKKNSGPRLQKEYSFKDEDVPDIFESLLENNKIKLPPIVNQEEVDNTADPKYCAYHRRILHPTKDCFTLKNSIQTLVEAGVISLN